MFISVMYENKEKEVTKYAQKKHFPSARVQEKALDVRTEHKTSWRIQEHAVGSRSSCCVATPLFAHSISHNAHLMEKGI